MNVLREKTSDGDLEHASKEKLMEGKIIGCLKEHFVILQQSPEGDHDPSKFLSKKCATHIEKIMSEEAQDFELDPELMKSCGGTSLSPLSEDGMCSRKKHTDPIECLKQHFMEVPEGALLAIAKNAKRFDVTFFWFEFSRKNLNGSISRGWFRFSPCENTN